MCLASVLPIEEIQIKNDLPANLQRRLGVQSKCILSASASSGDVRYCRRKPFAHPSTTKPRLRVFMSILWVMLQLIFVYGRLYSLVRENNGFVFRFAYTRTALF